MLSPRMINPAKREGYEGSFLSFFCRAQVKGFENMGSEETLFNRKGGCIRSQADKENTDTWFKVGILAPEPEMVEVV